MSNLGTRMSDVPLREYDWFMSEWFPLGEVGLIVGGPGTGKDILGAALIAATTRGRPMPDGTPAEEPSPAIVINTEDKSHTTTKPRLIAADADEDLVIDMREATNGAYRNVFSIGKQPDDLSLLRQRLTDLNKSGPPCRLVWISVLNSVATVNTRNGMIARDSIVQPLQAIAEDYNTFIALVHHTVKDGTIGGSQQLEDALRVIAKVRRDKDNDAVRVMSLYKSTSSRTDITPIRFEIEGERPFSRARFLAPDEALDGPESVGEPRPGTGQALVLQLLREPPGEPLRATEVSAVLGISHHTVRVWLQRLEERGLVSRIRRGVYQAVTVTNGPDLGERPTGPVTFGNGVTNAWASSS